MNQPTEQQISEAKAYIRMRVEAELSMKGNLESLLRTASRRLSALAAKYGMSVKQVVRSSRPQIRQQVNRIMDWLLFMVEDCVDTLAVGTHKDDSELIVGYIKREQYGKDFGQRLNGYVHGYIHNTDAAKSPAKALELLTMHAVAEGWMHWWGLAGRRNGATGFFSFRGSSYPCDLCNSMVGYHPMSDYVGLWHPHCKCYFVFI